MQLDDTPQHEPVMASEVVTALQAAQGGVFLDCTVGAGGHTRALLAAGADRVLALDRDQDALAIARRVLEPWRDRVELVHADFRQVDAVLDAHRLASVDGAVADLGVSSMQLDAAGRGFSFRRDEPLDMRMDRSSGPTAAELLDDVGEAELADVIYRYGEDRRSRRIARVLIAARAQAPLTSTGQVAAAVRRAVPRRPRQRLDPATRTFQALRIWVNRELDALDAWLVALCRRLRAGARLAVLTFHSLEDRIVKHTLRGLGTDTTAAVRVLTRRPIRPAAGEVGRNPRARSAKLRIAERLG